MAYGECPEANTDCKYFVAMPKPNGNIENGCFSDAHHIYQKELYKAGTAKRFSRLAENVIQLCRSEHDEIHATGDIPDMPSIEHMKERLAENGK